MRCARSLHLRQTLVIARCIKPAKQALRDERPDRGMHCNACGNMAQRGAISAPSTHLLQPMQPMKRPDPLLQHPRKLTIARLENCFQHVLTGTCAREKVIAPCTLTGTRPMA